MAYRKTLWLAALCAAICLHAQNAPQPPCGTSPFPPYPDAEGSPVVKVWERADWAPAECTGWSRSDSVTLVATAARFRYSGGAEGLRWRIGAVSGMSGLLYWSTTNQKWQPLVIGAYALTAPDGERRKDFTLEEIAAGHSLAVQQEDNLLGKAVYQMRITAAAADRLAFATENRTPIRMFGLTLFEPGEIQSVCFLDGESKDVWRYYNLTRMPKQAGVLTMGHNASLINRAVAFYRYLAGIRADREPPAAK
ncbi:MAG TPA: DUF6675 family protein [Candidatus Sulfopaludibacter sp.]|nr:DUF6675 family protein [Candidatus Sulfopaludibacter sp.]